MAKGDLGVKAQSQGHTPGHSWFRGSVDLRFGEVRINADSLDLFSEKLPDGTEKRRLVAEGNVVFIQGEERLTGRKLDMDLNTGKGVFDSPYGYVSPGLFVEGKTLERLDPKTYKIDDPKFTSCAQPNPRWSFSSSSATVKVGDKVTAWNTLMKIKSTPTPIYFPWFTYPLDRDGRSTGLLFPKFGFGANRGFETGLGFFWAMGRSYDQTFLFDNYTKVGYGIGHEFRYAASPASRGTFNTYLFNQREAFLGREPSGWEYDVDANVQQMFPGAVRFSARAREYSSLGFQQRFQENVNYATNRSRFTSASLSKSFGTANLSVSADRNETFYGEDQSAKRRHLPTVRLRQSNTRIGGTGLLLSYDARGEGLQRGNQDRLDEYRRFDFNPELSRPTNLSFLQFTPRVRYRATRYGATLARTDDTQAEFLRNDSLDRRYYEIQAELRGPNFSKVMGGIGSYTDKIKHVIGPEITYTYRDGNNIDFDFIPKFDGEDYIVGTNQVTYGIYQSLLARRPVGTSGRTAPYEFLSWRVAQTYYGDVSQGAQFVDPNYESSSYETNDGAARVIRTSPIQSRLRFRPTRSFSTDFTLEYDTHFSAFKSIRLSTGWDARRFAFDVGFYKSVNLAARERALGNPNFTGLYRSGTARASFHIIPTRLSLHSRADYDFENKRLFNAVANLKYNVQCCGFSLLAYQKGLFINAQGEEKPTWGFKVQFELANIGGLLGASDREGALSGRRY